MNYQINDDASGMLIKISGDLDFSANAEFKKIVGALTSRKGRTVTFELSNVSHIDSVGLGLLYIAKEEVGSSGGKICLKSPQAGVQRMLQLTEADTDFDIRA